VKSSDLPKFFAKQISLTEWLDAIGFKHTAAMRNEDNDKRERLKVLRQIIGLPFDQPYQFSGEVVAARTAEFRKFLTEHGDELCAIRLIPTKPDLPKLRIRGQSINDAVVWFDQQDIDPTNYRVDFVPHTEVNTWGTIFVVNNNGVFGEIIPGGHHQLTQGFHDKTEPIVFTYDFKSWQLSRENPKALQELQQTISMLRVTKVADRKKLAEELNATFSHNHLKGYFETVASEEFGTWFIDYSRILGDKYHDFVVTLAVPPNQQKTILKGMAGSKGKVIGRARVIGAQDAIADVEFDKNDILVCPMTTPDHLPLMQRASAIITDAGGILSHAAIVARELGIPCITGTKYATSTLQTGDNIEVDADNGTVVLVAESVA